MLAESGEVSVRASLHVSRSRGLKQQPVDGEQQIARPAEPWHVARVQIQELLPESKKRLRSTLLVCKQTHILYAIDALIDLKQARRRESL